MKTLVTYASRYGSTAEVAAAIAVQLHARGNSADARAIEEVTDVSGYDAVVIGSAVRMGRWLPEAVAFVTANQETLRRVPTAFFTVHILALDESEASQRQRAAYAEEARAIVTPQDEAFFAGKIGMSQLRLGERLLTKAVHAPTTDLRDWSAIQRWADQLFQKQEVLL